MLKKAAVAALLVIVAILVVAIINELPTASAGTIVQRGCGDPDRIAQAPDPSQDTGAPIEMLGADDVGTVLTLTVSGYTSTKEQTDDTPCIAARNVNICKRKAKGELLCAASREFPFGTKLEVQGLGTCEVVDYMPADRRMSADWYFGQDAPGKTTLYSKAMKIDKRIPRQAKVVSIPQ